MICEDGRECCRKTEKIRIDGSWGNPKNYNVKTYLSAAKILSCNNSFQKGGIVYETKRMLLLWFKTIIPKSNGECGDNVPK